MTEFTQKHFIKKSLSILEDYNCLDPVMHDRYSAKKN